MGTVGTVAFAALTLVAADGTFCEAAAVASAGAGVVAFAGAAFFAGAFLAPAAFLGLPVMA